MTDFDRIIASRAINKTAGAVVSKGAHWVPRKKFDPAAWQDTPLPTLPFPKTAQNMIAPGTKVCRLTVIGYGGTRSDTAAYVVRCQCGMYGYRRAKSLRSATVPQMCNPCGYLEDVKAGKTLPPYAVAELRRQKQERKARAATATEPTPTLADVFAQAELARRRT